MTDTLRASVFERRQLGVEALGASGTAVAANVLLQSLNFVLSPDAEVDMFGPEGQKYDTLQALNKEWSVVELSGQPTYTELVYFLSSLLTNPTITTPGGATLTRDWLWQPKSAARDTSRTYTVEQGEPHAATSERATGVILREGRLAFSRNAGNEIGGGGIGKRLEYERAMSTNEVQQVSITGGPTGGTFTLTFSGQTTAPLAYNASASAVQSALEALSNIGTGGVYASGGPLPGTAVSVEFRGDNAQTNVATMTADGALLTGGASPAVAVTTTTPGVAPIQHALVPILPGEVDVYMDDTYGAIGTSKLEGDFSAAWELGDRFNPVYVLNSALTSYKQLIEARPTSSLALTMFNDPTGRALINRLRDGATKYVRIQATGPLIEAGFNYRLRLDVAGKVVEAPGRGDEDGASTLEWTFRPVHDSTFGRAMEASLRTTLTALGAA